LAPRADADHDPLVREDAGLRPAQPAQLGVRGDQVGVVALDARTQPAEAGALDSGAQEARGGEGDLVPGRGHGAGDGGQRQEVPERRVAGEQRAHATSLEAESRPGFVGPGPLW
jgi:hypothetical protein